MLLLPQKLLSSSNLYLKTIDSSWTIDETENFLKNFIEEEPEDTEERELMEEYKDIVEKTLIVLW